MSKSAFLMFFGNALYRHFWPIEITLKLKIKVKSYSITHILSLPCQKCPKKDYLFWWPICLKSENPSQKWHLQESRGWDPLLLNCLIGNGLKYLWRKEGWLTGIKSTNEHFCLWILTGFGRWIYTWKSCLECGFRTDLPVWHCYAALNFFLSTHLVCLTFLMMCLDGICSWNDFRVVYEKKITGGDLWAFGGNCIIT